MVIGDLILVNWEILEVVIDNPIACIHSSIEYLGKRSIEKNCLLSGIAQISYPSKRLFSKDSLPSLMIIAIMIMIEMMDNDDTNYHKSHIHTYYEFSAKMNQFSRLLLCEKGPTNSGKGRPPPLFGRCPKVNDFFL